MYVLGRFGLLCDIAYPMLLTFCVLPLVRPSVRLFVRSFCAVYLCIRLCKMDLLLGMHNFSSSSSSCTLQVLSSYTAHLLVLHCKYAVWSRHWCTAAAAVTKFICYFSLRVVFVFFFFLFFFWFCTKFTFPQFLLSAAVNFLGIFQIWFLLAFVQQLTIHHWLSVLG